MSRRSRRGRARTGEGREPAHAERGGAARSGARAPTGPARDAHHAPGRDPYRIRPAAQVAILVAVVAVVTLIAELAGAANLGTALSIGQLVFAVALIVVLVKS